MTKTKTTMGQSFTTAITLMSSSGVGTGNEGPGETCHCHAEEKRGHVTKSLSFTWPASLLSWLTSGLGCRLARSLQGASTEVPAERVNSICSAIPSRWWSLGKMWLSLTSPTTTWRQYLSVVYMYTSPTKVWIMHSIKSFVVFVWERANVYIKVILLPWCVSSV